MKPRRAQNAMHQALLVLLGILGGRPLLVSAEAQSATAVEKGTSPPLVVRLSVDLVQVDAVVTDAKGRPVTDLRAADFEILQDGRVQAVTQAEIGYRATLGVGDDGIDLDEVDAR